MITLTTDFAVQSVGIAQMHSAIHEICPEARIYDLMHGLPDYDTMTAAWALESVLKMPVGKHVCVVDPGVGSQRLGLIIETRRGDFLIGPDNGVLLPAARLLGLKEIVSIDRKLRPHVSAVFHGRDVFAPAAAMLEKREAIFTFGPVIDPDQLMPAPYGEARAVKGAIVAKVIHINKFGSAHLNILQKEFEALGVKKGAMMVAEIGGRQMPVRFARTFSDVPTSKAVIFDDDYLRMELALNQDNLAARTGLKLSDTIKLRPK